MLQKLNNIDSPFDLRILWQPVKRAGRIGQLTLFEYLSHRFFLNYHYAWVDM